MSLFNFIAKEAGKHWGASIGFAALSGISNASVLAILAFGIKNAGQLRPGLLVALLVACVLYWGSYRRCVEEATRLVETALYRVRLRLCQQILRANLHQLEQLGSAELYEQIVQQTATLSNGSWNIIIGIQAATFVLFTVVYIAFLSATGLWLVLLFCCLAIFVYRSRSQRLAGMMKDAAASQATVRSRFSDILCGLKEIRFRASRASDLLADHRSAAVGLKYRTIILQVYNHEMFAIALVGILALMSIVIFILPQNLNLSTRSLTELTAAIIFLYNPLNILAVVAPEYGQASAAASSLQRLEQRLSEDSPPQSPSLASPWAGQVATLQLDDLVFHHRDPAEPAAFSLGPISLTLRAGEITFLVGGNGSGKTTLLKLVAALYPPASGAVLADGIAVTAENRTAYQQLFSAVFTDFHLFGALYGLPDATDAQVNARLEEFQLSAVTRYENGKFTNLNLSSGQRKRLAMVVALVEDRPIYLFDEWAAEQDPQFRRYYYEQLLPELRRRGKTVVAISHDDRYFHAADRLIHMESGRLRERVPAGTEASPGSPQPAEGMI